MIKKTLIQIMAVMMCFAFCQTVSAQMLSADLPDSQGLKLGDTNARLHVGMKTSLIYDDNIYLSKDNKKDDIITVLEPMVAIVAPFGDNRFIAEYKFSEYLYADYTKEDHPDHLVKGLIEINMTDYRLTLAEQYQRFTNRANTEDSTRMRQQNNDFRAGIATVNENRLGFDIGYRNRIEDYISNEIITGNMKYDDKDRMYHIADIQLLYRFAPKTSLIFETDLGWIRYDNDYNADSFYVEPLIGIKGELTNKITANIRGGYRYQEYETSSLVINDDFESAVVRGGIDFQMTKDDLVNLAVERSAYESTYKNINYYEGTSGMLKYTHAFSKKLSLSPYGTYQWHRYAKETTEDSDTKKRRDKIFGGGVSLKYNMRDWVALEAKYDYKEKDSNFDKFDYKDNAVTVSATIGF
jgi:hypothetical protein